MPVSIIELKKAGSSADVSAAHAQLQTYLREFPALVEHWEARRAAMRPEIRAPGKALSEICYVEGAAVTSNVLISSWNRSCTARAGSDSGW